MNIKLLKQAINELLNFKIKSANDLMIAKRKIAKKYNIGIIRNSDILKYLKPLSGSKSHLEAYQTLRKILRKRTIRTLSGIAPVAVLTKPYPCPGKCVYCPTEKNVPQSYLSNEPAVMRAIRCNYNPYIQVQARLRALEANGHNPEKIEIIIIGGTWSVLPKEYKYWFITECFRGANEYKNQITNYPGPPAGAASGAGKLQITNKSKITNSKFKTNDIKIKLHKEQKYNEKAKYRIIGLTLETRPDYINEKELLEMRELGCTRVELGVQAIDDKILKINKRGHDIKAISKATKLLKIFGFKVTYHIMPNLPGSTPTKDYKMYKQLFFDQRFQPDQIKFYPTIVTKGSLLYRWWKAKKYKPYTGKQLQNLIIRCKNITPSYVRIIRLIRDIPKESIMAGNLITNLRQIMKDKGANCQCIRCREARDLPIKNPQLKITKYQSSDGEEYFISYQSKDGKILYGFCRLRLMNSQKLSFGYPKLSFEAIIRELHVYGELVPVGETNTSAGSEQAKIQHAGLGKKLMAEAERIAKRQDYKKIAVIAGIGVRNYYRKLGYRLKNTYMIKILI